MYDVHISQQPVKQFPKVIEEDERAYLAIKNFLAHRKGNLLRRMVRYVKQRMG
jgi:hypothetical protein